MALKEQVKPRSKQVDERACRTGFSQWLVGKDMRNSFIYRFCIVVAIAVVASFIGSCLALNPTDFSHFVKGMWLNHIAGFMLVMSLFGLENWFGMLLGHLLLISVWVLLASRKWRMTWICLVALLCALPNVIIGYWLLMAAQQ